jgi:hypothetical protein
MRWTANVARIGEMRDHQAEKTSQPGKSKRGSDGNIGKYLKGLEC